MRRLPLAAAAVAAVLAPVLGVAADPFPGRRGLSGVLDVPDAEVVGRGGGLIGGELRLDMQSSARSDVGPMPVSLVTGVLDSAELGFSMREWGYPGDPRPSPLLFGAATKLRLVEPLGVRPGLALALSLDRFNLAPVAGAQLVASTSALGPLRFAAFAGVDGQGSRLGTRAFTGGLAATLALTAKLDLAAEGVRTGDGDLFGAALRYRVANRAGVSLGASWLPDEKGFRVSLGFGLLAASPRRKRLEPAVTAPEAEATPAEATPEELAAGDFQDPVPHFRLRIRASGAERDGHQQYGPFTAPASRTALPTRPSPAAPALSPDDLLESRAAELQASVDARRRRLLETERLLQAREGAAQDEAQRLGAEEQRLAQLQQALELRARAVRGAPTAPERQLESEQAQHLAATRQLAGQEAGFANAIEAALGSERSAGEREAAERHDAELIAAGAKGLTDRRQALDATQRAIAARQRELAATELRLVAMGERLDAVEHQLRARGDRVGALQRAVAALSSRVDLGEKRAAARALAGAEPASRAPASPAGAAGRDKAVFVMVVKSPTAVVKGAAPASAPAREPGQDALHAGAAVERAVAAATVVSFPTPDAQLSELDWEGIDRVATLAAKDGCELLIWSRAKDPGLLAEASRRAAEIKLRAIRVAALAEKQIVTRITTRPGAAGIDVVVSALRDRAVAAPAPTAAAPAPSAPVLPASSPGRAPDALQAGETGRRQLREAVIAVQPSIETCIGPELERRRLSRAEGVLSLRVGADGRVVKLEATSGDLASAELGECLSQAAKGWTFPKGDTEYVVEIPITIVGAGAKR